MTHGDDCFEINAVNFFLLMRLLPTKDGKSISAITRQNLWHIVNN